MPLYGNSEEEQIWNYLLMTGNTPVAAAAIMGNMKAESGFNPQRVQNTKNGEGDRPEVTVNGPGYGLVQFTDPGLQQGLVEHAAEWGRPSGDMEVQLSYLNKRLGGRVMDTLNNMSDVRKAAAFFEEDFERPAVSNASTRGQYAAEILGRYGGDITDTAKAAIAEAERRVAEEKAAENDPDIANARAMAAAAQAGLTNVSSEDPGSPGGRKPTKAEKQAAKEAKEEAKHQAALAQADANVANNTLPGAPEDYGRPAPSNALNEAIAAKEAAHQAALRQADINAFTGELPGAPEDYGYYPRNYFNHKGQYPPAGNFTDKIREVGYSGNSSAHDAVSSVSNWLNNSKPTPSPVTQEQSDLASWAMYGGAPPAGANIPTVAAQPANISTQVGQMTDSVNTQVQSAKSSVSNWLNKSARQASATPVTQEQSDLASWAMYGGAPPAPAPVEVYRDANNNVTGLSRPLSKEEMDYISGVSAAQQAANQPLQFLGYDDFGNPGWNRTPTHEEIKYIQGVAEQSKPLEWITYLDGTKGWNRTPTQGELDFINGKAAEEQRVRAAGIASSPDPGRYAAVYDAAQAGQVLNTEDSSFIAAHQGFLY